MSARFDDRLIVALDVPTALAGLELARRLGPTVHFYKIGLGMLTGGGLALANELKQDFGKRIFLDMKLFDIGATVEAAVRGLAQYEIDFLTVHGDPHVVRAAMTGAGSKGPKILAVTVLTSLDRADLDAAQIRPGSMEEIVLARAAAALDAGADGVIASPQEAAAIRALPQGPTTSSSAAPSGPPLIRDGRQRRSSRQSADRRDRCGITPPATETRPRTAPAGRRRRPSRPGRFSSVSAGNPAAPARTG